MSQGYVHWDCWTCRSLQPAPGERHRRWCSRHGWGIAAPHLSVCRDWWPYGLDEARALLGELPPGKLYEVHGAHEHFEEVTDLAREGASSSPTLEGVDEIPF